jgi:formate dehydrogenase major subunit
LAKTIGNGAATNSFTEISKYSNCILMIGSNPENGHPIAAMHIQRALDRGAKLIVIDPIKTEMAQKADVHIQLPPEHNIPVINALINYIIANDLCDDAFIAQYTTGIEYVKEAVKAYTPENVSKLTGVPQELLEKAARLYATIKPAALTHGMGVTHFNHGVGNVYCVSNLFLITGNIGVLGAGDYPLRGQQNVQGACDMGVLPNVLPNNKQVSDDIGRGHLEKLWGCTLDNKVGIHKTEVPDEILNGKIKVFYTVGENPVVSEPNTNHFLKGIAHVGFYVVQDIFLTETALKADVVLPAVCGPEKIGLYANAERRVQMNKQAVLPVGDVKQDWEIICEIAKGLGAEGFEYENTEDIWEEVRLADPERYGGMSYRRIIAENGLNWPCPTLDHPGTPTMYLDRQFYTPDKKAHFVPVVFVSDKQEIPLAEKHLAERLNLPEGYPLMAGSVDEPTDEKYPIELLTTRKACQYTVGTMTRRSIALELGADYNGSAVEINLYTAKKYDVEDGDFIKIWSRYGDVAVKVAVTEVVPDNVIQMYFHYWEGHSNELTSGGLDPISKTPTYKAAVQIAKISEKEYLSILAKKKEKFTSQKIIYEDCHH